MKPVCIIIGGSHAGGQLAASLRSMGWDGRICLISEENYLPYHHPPLSKEFLSGEKEKEELLLRKMPFYEKQEIEFWRGKKVVSIEPPEKQIRLDSGEVLTYDKLVICTGARVRKLDLGDRKPENIYYLRNLEDSLAIRQALSDARKAIVIGAGYIGLEVAASLKEAGLEVTVIEKEDRVMKRVACPELSAFFREEHEKRGIRILCNVEVAEYKGKDRIEQIVCQSGERMEADILVVGIGVVPNVKLAEDAGLEVADGIVVDEFARTSAPDIFAAGDCTRHPNVRYGYDVRLESVANASDQARIAAGSICGKPKVYDSLPWFWSDQFDLKLQTAGLFEEYDEIVIRKEETDTPNIVVWYLKDGELLAADCVNNPRAFMIAKQILMKGIPVDRQQLGDPSFELKEIVRPSSS